MHRQHSSHTLRSLHLGAIHFVLNALLIVAAISLLTAGIIIGDNNWLWIGTSVLAVWIISAFVFFLCSLSWHCPLCMGKVWVRTGCRRHRNLRPALGISYRLGIALCVLFKSRYRCPYCGEPFSTRKAHK